MQGNQRNAPEPGSNPLVTHPPPSQESGPTACVTVTRCGRFAHFQANSPNPAKFAAANLPARPRETFSPTDKDSLQVSPTRKDSLPVAPRPYMCRICATHPPEPVVRSHRTTETHRHHQLRSIPFTQPQPIHKPSTTPPHTSFIHTVATWHFAPVESSYPAKSRYFPNKNAYSAPFPEMSGHSSHIGILSARGATAL